MRVADIGGEEFEEAHRRTLADRRDKRRYGSAILGDSCRRGNWCRQSAHRFPPGQCSRHQITSING